MTTIVKKLEYCDYYGKFFIMYRIGRNIPSIIDRTLSICDKKLRWSKANITNKLPIYLIPIETKYDDLNDVIFKEMIEISPSSTYYLATVHNNKIYVIDKSFNNYSLVPYSEKTINSQFIIPPNQETFALVPNTNIYMVGNPKELSNGESDFSSYKGSVFMFTATEPVENLQASDVILQKIEKFRNGDSLTGVFKNTEESDNNNSMMILLYVFLVIIFLAIIIGLVIYFMRK